MKLDNLLKSESFSLKIIYGGVILVILTIILYSWSDYKIILSNKVNAEKLGQFGDFVGGVIGSMWALAGVLLFYLALTEQRNDFKVNQNAFKLQVDALNQQIEEFKLQREELESSRKIYEEQSKTIRLQQFESNFYALLNVHLTIKNDLNNLLNEKDYFKALYESLIYNYNYEMNSLINHKNLIERYTNIYTINRGHLSHYFKSIYRILKIIDTNFRLDEKEKMFYSKILRSQLTDYEQLALYYNSHSIFGEKARPLILKYNFLKNTPLFNKPEFNHFYKIQENHDIIFFSDWINKFLSKHINNSYDLSDESDKMEEKCDHFDCIVGIYFNDSIIIKVFLKKNIKENGINLSEEQFIEFFLILLYEFVALNSYLNTSKINLTNFKTDFQDTKEFGVKIESQERILINKDQY